MPELVEVYFVAQSLKSILQGKKFISLSIEPKSRYYGKPFQHNDVFQRQNLFFTDVISYGKKIIFMLHDTETKSNVIFVSFLAMEGKWLLEPLNNTSLILISENSILYFDDSRHFGSFTVCKTQEEYQNVFKDTGPCLLTRPLEINRFKELIRNKRIKNKEICMFLVEQKYFSGIGNYLRSEILFHAQINPHRNLESLNDIEIERIYNSMYYIINVSFQCEGFTLRTYSHVNGKKGSYVPLIYGLNTVYGFDVIKEKDSTGRTIHWCKEIQF